MLRRPPASTLTYTRFPSTTLFRTTNFVFTGLAVAVAFHAGLFNIGGAGQAYIGGLGVGLGILAVDHLLPFYLILPLAVLLSAAFGAAWAALAAYLTAYRGSPISSYERRAGKERDRTCRST